jgi:hydroxymethylglutaryl-CoA reductase (NADPH)
MSTSMLQEQTKNGLALELVPRLTKQGYDRADVDRRREWAEKKMRCRLPHVGSYTLDSVEMRGNIENPIGVAQVPLGLAGPLLISGEHARGTFYVPMATTEGALLRSYERGMVTLTRAGGVTVRIQIDENRVCPVFTFRDISQAHAFAARLPGQFRAICREIEPTTKHGKLLRIECHPIGREVIVNFCYSTADASGMNMIVKATHRACEWIKRNSPARSYYIFSGLSSEKRPSGNLLPGGKGKKVVAGALVPAAIVQAYLHTTPAAMVDLWHHTMLGHVQADAMGYNGHLANGLAAIFIACGQDVANIVNSAIGITNFETTEDGDLYASVTLPSLTVGTVGGGSGLGTARECLELLSCTGRGSCSKFAEIVAAALLAGEISMGAAIASDEFVEAHEMYGRNRPQLTEVAGAYLQATD